VTRAEAQAIEAFSQKPDAAAREELAILAGGRQTLRERGIIGESEVIEFGGVG
jgi:hypothetical protein